MSEDDFGAWEGRVWQAAAALGIEGQGVVHDRYRPLLTKFHGAGMPVELAADVLVEQVKIALDQFSVLADSLTIVTDNMQLVLQVLDGEDNPVFVGHGMTKLRAGIAVLSDEMANLAPFAGIDDPAFDPIATRSERLEACHERDTFLDQIRAAAESAE